jgi:hypothetical protein
MERKMENHELKINSGKLSEIFCRLSNNLQNVRYGIVAVSLRIHDGRVVDVTHSVTENTREKEK